MIQSYPVLFFFLAVLIDMLLKKKIAGIVAAPVILLFTYFNIWFTIQAHGGAYLYDPGGMTKSYYWAVAGRWKVSPQVQKLKDTDEIFEGSPKDMKLLYQNEFETDSLYNATQPAIAGNKSIFIRAHYYSPEYGFAYPKNNAEWIRVEATFHCLQKEWIDWRMLQMIVRTKHKGQVIKERILRVHRFLEDGNTKDLFLDVRLPEQHVDSVAVLFWNGESDQSMIIDNLRIYSFKE